VWERGGRGRRRERKRGRREGVEIYVEGELKQNNSHKRNDGINGINRIMKFM
jgi:hypothetical protein